MIYNFIYVPIDSYKRNYVVLGKHDLFGYNIIRRNRSKNKNKIKSYILGCRKFKASRDFKIQRRDGNENVAKKVNLRSFSLYRNYWYPLTLSNVGERS